LVLDDLHPRGLELSPVIDIADLNRLTNGGVPMGNIRGVYPYIERIVLLCLIALYHNDPPPAEGMGLNGEDLPLHLVGAYLFVVFGNDDGRKDAADAHEHEEDCHEDRYSLFMRLPLHDQTFFPSRKTFCHRSCREFEVGLLPSFPSLKSINVPKNKVNSALPYVRITLYSV
jgi:hypothetical protein